MDSFMREGAPNASLNQPGASPHKPSLTTVGRRDCLRMALGGWVGLALGGLLDLSKIQAAAQELKLANVSEFTTSCNFCSCGCGMIAAVRDGAIVYDELNSEADLPVGWTEEQNAGTYRLKRRNDHAMFGYTVGPHS